MKGINCGPARKGQRIRVTCHCTRPVFRNIEGKRMLVSGCVLYELCKLEAKIKKINEEQLDKMLDKIYENKTD